MWFSASVDLDPWIQYEFDDVKQLDVMTVWNANSAAEMAIGWGVKDVLIEYSVDGENWNVLADVTQLSRATGTPTYNQYDTIDFGGVAAKLVRLNIQNNWGGILMSYGLSEVQFSMIPAAVREPMPVSDSMDVDADTVLKWRAGRGAVQHTIYLGTDATAVTDGSASSVSSSTNSLDLNSLDLDLGATYYWRVDEVNEAEANPVWAGPVWGFTTVAALTVDDFDSYSNISPDRPFQTWSDGFGYSADEFFPAGYGGNGTGAGIGHDIWSLSSPHYDGVLMERTIAKSGQSMPLYFDNTTGTSEIQRTLDSPQDWTAHGIKSLSLSFRGQAGNSGQLYLKINDVKVAYSGIPNALQKSAWLSMIVDLSTVATNLNAVTSLAIGVEGAGAQGVVYLDELMLYPLTATVVEPVAPADNDADLAGLWKLDDGSGTTATDASGNNHHGVLTNGPFWTTDGAMGGALECDGIDDYVVLDTLSYGDNADFSVALWVKTTGWDSDAAIMSNKDWNSGGNVGWAIAGGAGNNGSWQWNYSDGSTRADFDPSVGAAPIAGGEWVHLCVTHDRDGLARFYHDGQPIGQVDISGLTGSLDAGFPTVLGTDGSEAAVWAYWFSGAFDDVRVYNRVLSEGEILGLNGVTDPVSQPF
ncbi:MAG: discoidin domain-containing protein, partial [Phycisphaeraceae bacterium]|nr:discoidin domain-containing protein [Phycisphaeraceae bacterium]